MSDDIEVSYTTYTTAISIRKVLSELSAKPLLSFDTEVRSVYTKEERTEAAELIECCQEELSLDDRLLCKLVANSSGLSHPKITEVTHWIFSYDIHNSTILVTPNARLRQLVADWAVNYAGKLLVHNAGFDIKILHHMTNKFPIDFEDTQLLAKTLINHTDTWKAKTGLKDLMGSYYDPSWSLYNEYDVDDLKDKDFLAYMAIDTSAVWLLWEKLQEQIKE